MALTLEEIVHAGVAFTRADCFEALSLRRVAIALGVTPMALYRHVRDSDALIEVVLDHIAGTIPAVPPTGDWRSDLETWASSARASFARHPGSAAAILTCWFSLPAMLGHVEALLSVAADAGFDGFEQVAAANAVLMYVLMRVEAERVVRTAGATRRTLRLAGDTLPQLRRLSTFYETADFDAHFEYGLKLVLDGLAGRSLAS